MFMCQFEAVQYHCICWLLVFVNVRHTEAALLEAIFWFQGVVKKDAHDGCL